MKKIIIILAIIALLLGFFIFKAKSSSNQPLKTETVKREDIVKSISASGKVDSQETVDLKFQSSGLLSWVVVKEGDRVQAWQAIGLFFYPLAFRLGSALFLASLRRFAPQN